MNVARYPLSARLALDLKITSVVLAFPRAVRLDLGFAVWAAFIKSTAWHGSVFLVEVAVCNCTATTLGCRIRRESGPIQNHRNSGNFRVNSTLTSNRPWLHSPRISISIRELASTLDFGILRAFRVPSSVVLVRQSSYLRSGLDSSTMTTSYLIPSIRQNELNTAARLIADPASP